MKPIHRLVVSFGVCATVALVTLAGTVAQATSHRSSSSSGDGHALTRSIEKYNETAGGCRE